MKKTILSVLICSGAFILVGCGGGGDKSKSDHAPKPTLPTEPTPVEPPPPSENTSTFSNTKVNMKIQYQNNENSIFNSSINFTIDQVGDISGQWDMPIGQSNVFGTLYKMTAVQYEQCYIYAKRLADTTTDDYLNHAYECLNKNQNPLSPNLVFRIHSGLLKESPLTIGNCEFLGEISRHEEGIKIMHLNILQGDKTGGTFCNQSNEKNYYHVNDILYWVNNSSGKTAETKNIFAQNFKTYINPNPPINNKKTASLNQCITIDRKSNSLADFLINKCGKRIWVKWIDQGWCKSGCASSVTTKASISKMKGTVSYAACPYPYAAYKPNAPKPAGYEWRGGSFECVDW